MTRTAHLARSRRAVRRRARQPQSRRRGLRRGLRRASMRRSKKRASTCSMTTATSGRARNSRRWISSALPWQVIVGPKSLAEGKVEVKNRRTGERELLTRRAASPLGVGRRQRSATVTRRDRAQRRGAPPQTAPATKAFSAFEWMVAFRYLRARNAQRLDLGHRRLFLPRHHAWRRGADRRHVGDERLPPRSHGQDRSASTATCSCRRSRRRSPTTTR